MFDSGIVLVFGTENAAERGSHPLRRLILKTSAYFQSRAVGMSRYYTAKQADVRIDKLIRIWRDESISTQDIASIDGERYEIKQVMHGVDNDELEITELSLERTVEKFDLQSV